MPATPAPFDDSALASEMTRRCASLDSARSARARLTIDLAGIAHNARVLRELSGRAQLMAVLKGDGYGLGGVPIARALSSAGVRAFAVDSVAEGLELRHAGVAGKILIIDGDLPENCGAALEAQLTPGVSNRELLGAYDAAARRLGQRCPVWLAMNVGFNRSGCDAASPEELLEAAQQARHLDVEATYAQMSCAHEAGGESEAQLELYRSATRAVYRILGPQVRTSILASHGIVRFADVMVCDWVRAGILLYGEHTFGAAPLLDARLRQVLSRFRDVVSLRARVSQLLPISRAACLGYGTAHRIHPGQRIATVALGYGYGYPVQGRELQAIVRGRRVPLVGAIGMDALQIDVSSLPSVGPLDWVTLIGRDGDERIEVSEVASRASLSVYALLRQLRCHREYVMGHETSR